MTGISPPERLALRVAAVFPGSGCIHGQRQPSRVAVVFSGNGCLHGDAALYLDIKKRFSCAYTRG